VDRLQQWARELEQEEKNWETDVAVFQAIRKGERESQNQIAGDSTKSIAKKDTDARPAAELVEQDSEGDIDSGSENDDSDVLFDTRTKEGLEQERAELEKQRVELGQDRTGWLTLVVIYNAIMKGDRASQTRLPAMARRALPRKVVTPSRLRSRWSRRVRSGWTWLKTSRPVVAYLANLTMSSRRGM